jgi:hypothetical protein
MSEYESALSDAISIAFAALVRLGIDPEKLTRELHEQADRPLECGALKRAATLRLLAQFIPERTPSARPDAEQPRE